MTAAPNKNNLFMLLFAIRLHHNVKGMPRCQLFNFVRLLTSCFPVKRLVIRLYIIDKQ